MKNKDAMEVKRLRSLLRLFAAMMIIIFIIAVKSAKEEVSQPEQDKVETAAGLGY